MAVCPAGRWTDSRPEPLWEHPLPLPLGKQKNFSVFGEYFRNSNGRDSFLLLAHGAKKGLLSSWVTENTGTPDRPALPRLATPGVCRPGPRGRPLRRPPPGGLTPQGLPSATTATKEGWSCVWVCLQRSVDWGYFGQGQIWFQGGLFVGFLVLFLFFNDNEVTL